MSKTAKIYPAYSCMPTLSNKDYLALAAQELIQAIKNINKIKKSKLQPSHKEALIQLARIFHTIIAPQYSPPRVGNDTIPRVTPKKLNNDVPHILQPHFQNQHYAKTSTSPENHAE